MILLCSADNGSIIHPQGVVKCFMINTKVFKPEKSIVSVVSVLHSDRCYLISIRNPFSFMMLLSFFCYTMRDVTGYYWLLVTGGWLLSAKFQNSSPLPPISSSPLPLFPPSSQ
jgi:hypothetical protein